MTRTPATFLELADLLAYVGQVIERGIPGAVWVRAELASVTDRRHLYLDVVQSGQDGREVAKARATLWARERFSLEGKFRRATGGGLAAGMSVLLMVTAEFHPQYGFSLHILDIAPEFTVGDMALKLEGIRRTLEQERLLECNRSLPQPPDYTRVAVISPANAAGLGDFRREADALAAAGLVQFVYFPATFQGREASSSILNTLGAALLAHAEEALDALVIIRGGGASTDLAWLNDLELARAVARFPVPVISGIGHARDDTILDEVACLRMDTPSKAAALIVSTVAAGAQQAQRDFRQIVAAGRAALSEADSGANWALDRVMRAAGRLVERHSNDLDATMKSILGLTPRRTLERGYALVRNAAGEVVTQAAQAEAGTALSLEFSDGIVGVRVESGG
ncbi:exodeoxyribonuclease VII large subunit [Deinococcus ruber]|uniref:Exodeoxyribonuclease 7 large subunit n=1 Tax=Deinococcus ruber TaxID=1848197 RepID=A0A918F4Z8_9DEIO|nr:exodeoxyribonuclease VII large subunit [Deinococcus ruber]GGR08364.1 exodeoxyribonuclease 7 large subunit [Deinococcus ruber]